jgi:hypothetical protein
MSIGGVRPAFHPLLIERDSLKFLDECRFLQRSCRGLAAPCERPGASASAVEPWPPQVTATSLLSEAVGSYLEFAVAWARPLALERPWNRSL